jgi:hypothetical protein
MVMGLMGRVGLVMGLGVGLGIRIGMRIGETMRDLLGRIVLLGICMIDVIRSGRMGLLFRDVEKDSIF